ncbi:hypothetical protein [Pedobacter sp.]|uniref:hypothetical protein n=1 Tax=Pedobacter sp. TaxID=1411316 RepID=UPI0031D4B263
MKNLFKFGFLALALSLTAVACTPKNNSATTENPGDTSVVDTTVVDTTKAVDTNVKTDTAKAATPAAH